MSPDRFGSLNRKHAFYCLMIDTALRGQKAVRTNAILFSLPS